MGEICSKRIDMQDCRAATAAHHHVPKLSLAYESGRCVSLGLLKPSGEEDRRGSNPRMVCLTGGSDQCGGPFVAELLFSLGQSPIGAVKLPVAVLRHVFSE